MIFSEEATACCDPCEIPDTPKKRKKKKGKKIGDNFDKQVVSKRNMGEYENRIELWDQTYYAPKGTPPLKMHSCYSTTDGSYMGSTKKNFLTRCVRNYGLKQIQSSSPNHHVAVIGYSEKWKNREGVPVWVGWSHRAMCSFGIGDKIFEERHAEGWPESRRMKIPFVRHGKITIRNMEQAKQAAKNFAEYVG